MFASGFSWFHLMPALTDDALFGAARKAALGDAYEPLGTALFAHASMVAVVIILLAVLARLQLNKAIARDGLEKYFADDKLTVLSGFEVYATAWYGLAKDIISESDAKYYFWIPGGFFLYIFANNIIGIIPGLLPPTDNANTNAVMAFFAFAATAGIGLARDPGNFIKHMMGPLLPLAVLIFPVELIGLFIRPVSLTLRLTGNMFGDHTVFGIMSDLIPPVWPVAFLALACFVSFMQAFIFSILSVVYISMSVPHHDEDHH